jgi:2,4-dienoyl-CoA reductase-like NADH-dependent reductase (Old Yellow Enzyme family)
MSPAEMSEKRKQIFESTELGRLCLKNRLVRSATWEGLADRSGHITPHLFDIYKELARGQIGLIISSYMYVSPEAQQNIGQISVADDSSLPGLKKLADIVHTEGGTIVAQLVHCGGQANREVSSLDPVAPSAVSDKGYREVPKELSPEGIGKIIQDFVDASLRIKKSGFDGIQLHGAHGYLLSQFLSPLRNRRNDRYGGSLENRSRFPLEVFRAIRSAVGKQFPVMIKINGSDFLEGSSTIEDSKYLFGRLAEEGIDAVEVSGGTPGSRRLGAVRPDILTREDEAYFRDQAGELGRSVPDVPLMLVGGIRSVEVMEEILSEGYVDYFSMSRPLIREPDLPKRWASGGRERAECRSCLGCFRPARKGEGIRCVRKGAD